MPQIADPSTEATPKKSSIKEKLSSLSGKNKRTLTIAGVCVLAVAGSIFLLSRFLGDDKGAPSEIYSKPVEFGVIESRVQGNGTARAKETSAITLTQNGTVRDVFVSVGDIVFAGQPLYDIYSPTAQDEVEKTKKQLAAANRELEKLQKKFSALNVTAPFAGKIVEAGDFSVGDSLSEGTQIATIVNDKKLKLSLYFSYAYEKDISVGQTVDVSVPAVMNVFQGTVEKINKVSYISPEGAVHFEVIISFQNPGTLTAEMDASAVLYAKDGAEIYPYENTKTQYYEQKVITAETSGPITRIDLLRYANVSAGQSLLTMGEEDLLDQIAAQQETVDNLTESMETAQQALDNFNATAPIDGKIVSLNLAPGDEVKQGDTVVMISNSTNMIVDITVDDRNISFISPNMEVALTDKWAGLSYTGIVTKIDTANAEIGQGMTKFPVTLTVDNFDGGLTEGSWLEYSFATSRAEGILAPMQAIMSMPDINGEIQTVVFIRADKKPENAVELDLPEREPGATPKFPTEKEGFYPVAVVTGLSDTSNVEIKEGLSGEEELFISYYTSQGSSW